MRTRTQYLKVECQWRIQGGFLWFRGTPFLSFCVRASPASCARTSAVENVLDSGTPPFKILDPPLQPNTIHHCDCACGYILLGESRNRLTVSLKELDLVIILRNYDVMNKNTADGGWNDEHLCSLDQRRRR